MTWYLLLPLILQGVLVGVDELFCHRSRGLSLLEARLHIIDTLLAALPLLVILVAGQITSSTMAIYTVVSTLSCLSITKEEGLHQKVCGPWEHWIHSLMFMVHPLVYISLGYQWVNNTANLAPIALTYFIMMLSFTLYQLVYWHSTHKRQARKAVLVDNSMAIAG